MANIIFVTDKKTVKMMNMMMLTLMTTTKCWVQMMILRYARYQENCAPWERAAVPCAQLIFNTGSENIRDHCSVRFREFHEDNKNYFNQDKVTF